MSRYKKASQEWVKEGAHPSQPDGVGWPLGRDADRLLSRVNAIDYERGLNTESRPALSGQLAPEQEENQ